MSTRKSSLFYIALTAVASIAVGMVIASRLDLAPASSAQTVAIPPMNSAPLAGPIDAATFRNIAKLTAPAVVNIQTEVRQRNRDLTEYFGGSDDLLQRFFGGGGGCEQGAPRNRNRAPRQQDAPVMEGAGTGFIIDASGFVLTNNHVVDGAETIRVSLYGADRLESYSAKIVGHDTLTDTALLQLTEMPQAPLTPIRFGDSEQMQAGDWVMAIGNPFRLGHSVSVGVISALGRPFGGTPGRTQNMLQTDAAINPGNSGGPLLNVRGEVVGINTAIYTDSRQQGNIGIGFAIPINSVRELIPQLQTGRVSRGVIGVSVSPVPADALEEFGLKDRRGALVGTVSRGKPAAKAGIEPGDIILEFNGKGVKNRDELVATVVSTKPGSTVPVKILRDKQEKTVSLTVEELDLDDEGNRAVEQRTSTEPDEEPSQGFGVTLSVLTPDTAKRLRAADAQGVLVSDVEQGSPAFRAGLVRGDIITRVNRQAVRTPQEASRALAQVPSGGTAFLLVLRGGQEQFFTVRKE